ncbi:hypothetical protein L1987_15476 [Smallanthus sonchifolius]|uniref:Uncharacterized protein n=1 Tax=Smallanthus sonchifolius TaxID=185202 RepID=A0ACB9J6I1_9ASTR|nr:hypothetical protein L1987_15476 [Smallanthus sonchifolius]
MEKLFSGIRELKQDILSYIMRVGDKEGSLGVMARYVKSKLAWNGMNLIVFLINMFVCSRSPVQQPVVQYEVRNLARVLACVLKSDCPQYFRYFCTAEEEELLARKIFQLLGAVAQDLMNRKFRNKSISNFAGTSEKGGEETQMLIKKHLDFCKRKMVSSKKGKIKFIFDDYTYEELLDGEEDEAEAECSSRYLMNVSLSHEMRKEEQCFCEIICKSVSNKALPAIVQLDGALSRQVPPFRQLASSVREFGNQLAILIGAITLLIREER